MFKKVNYQSDFKIHFVGLNQRNDIFITQALQKYQRSSNECVSQMRTYVVTSFHVVYGNVNCFIIFRRLLRKKFATVFKIKLKTLVSVFMVPLKKTFICL